MVTYQGNRCIHGYCAIITSVTWFFPVNPVSAKKVDADWEQYLQNLSTLIQSCDQSSIREQSEELRSLLVFLGQCPQKLSPQLSI